MWMSLWIPTLQCTVRLALNKPLNSVIKHVISPIKHLNRFKWIFKYIVNIFRKWKISLRTGNATDLQVQCGSIVIVQRNKQEWIHHLRWRHRDIGLCHLLRRTSDIAGCETVRESFQGRFTKPPQQQFIRPRPHGKHSAIFLQWRRYNRGVPKNKQKNRLI